MYLILKRNYSNPEVTRFVDEAVAVKTLDNKDWEHIVFQDFVSYEDFKLINSTERKVACVSWRADFNHSWNHLDKEQYVTGIVVQGRLYIVLKDNKPLIQKDEELNKIEVRPKASVTTLLS